MILFSYDCEWYRDDIPEKSKKLLHFMMLVSHRPRNLTAGKIYALGLENFAAVILQHHSYLGYLFNIK